MENRLQCQISVFFLKLKSYRFKATWRNNISELEKESLQLATGNLDLYINCHHSGFLCKALHTYIIVLSEFIKICCDIITTEADV